MAGGVVTTAGGATAGGAATAGGEREGWYARLVEFGTSAHEAGGKFKGAMHPGTSARPFFYPAWRANKRRAKARISRAITRAAKKVAASS
jgi:HK97 gp10 family phage protein